MKFLITLLLILYSMLVIAQQYNFSTYSVEDGLSQSQVYDIVEDPNSYFWVATNGGGINIFDGKSFRQLGIADGLPSNRILSLLRDNQNNIWIGLNKSGLAVYNGKNIDSASYKELSRASVNDILQDKNGVIWIATAEQGLYSIKEGVLKRNNLVEAGRINVLFQDNAGNIYVGSSKKGLFVIRDNEVVNYDTDKGLVSPEVTSVVEGESGIVWIGTDKGVNLLTSTGVESLEGMPFSKNCRITDIYIDNIDRVWIAGSPGGLYRYSSGSYVLFDVESGLPGEIVNCIYQDKSGIYWFGMEGKGLCKFSGERFTHFAKEDGLKNVLTMDFVEDSLGNIWIATYGGGLYKYTGQKFKNYSNPNEPGLVSNMIYDLFIDSKERMWIGSKDNGLSIYDKNTFNPLTSVNGAKIQSVYAIIEDDYGNVWFASHDNGLFIRTNDDRYIRFSTETGLVTEMFYALFKDSAGNIFIGTDNRGVMVISSKDIPQLIDEPELFPNLSIIFNEKSGLPSDLVFAFAEDKYGTIWMGSFGKGISSYKNRQFTNYNIEDGLNSNYVYLMYYDSYGFLWVGTDKGLNKISLNNKSEIENIRTYSKNEGFVGIETNINAVTEDSKGRLWFGNIKGATVYNPKADKENTHEPDLNLLNIDLFFEEVNWADYKLEVPSWSNVPENLVLPHNKNHLTFNFVGIDRAAPEKVQYQWMLENFDEKWSPITNKNEVTYSNIPPGEYVFMVKAGNSDGVWNKEPLVFKFEVTPPFWMTWWFWVLVVVSITGIIIYYIKLRERQLIREKQLLEQKVKLRTHELYREKQTVEKQKEEISGQATRLEDINKELEKLSIVARETDNSVLITDETGEILWVNEGFTRMYGYTLEEYRNEVGSNIFTTSMNPNIEGIVDICFKEKKSVVYDIPSKTRHGRKIWTQTNLTPIMDDKKNITKLVAIDSDITGIKMAEEEIKQQNEEILAQRDRLSEVNEELTHKNTQITDSIRYARKIQQAILPSDRFFKSVFPDSFVLFMPRDIVSGDFYWIAKHGSKHFIAVADCTGHGVPGAFMSIIGNTLLNEIINEKNIFNPAEVLNELNRSVKNALQLNKDDAEQRTDGMDITVCCVNSDTNELEIACANHMAYLVTDTKTKIVSGDIYSVGDSFADDNTVLYHREVIKAPKGSMLYLFSDGYQDQFGGPLNKKYMAGNFLKLLEELHQLPPKEQSIRLKANFERWIRGYRQIDDILVIGIKF